MFNAIILFHHKGITLHINKRLNREELLLFTEKDLNVKILKQQLLEVYELQDFCDDLTYYVNTSVPTIYDTVKHLITDFKRNRKANDPYEVYNILLGWNSNAATVDEDTTTVSKENLPILHLYFTDDISVSCLDIVYFNVRFAKDLLKFDVTLVMNTDLRYSFWRMLERCKIPMELILDEQKSQRDLYVEYLNLLGSRPLNIKGKALSEVLVVPSVLWLSGSIGDLSISKAHAKRLRAHLCKGDEALLKGLRSILELFLIWLNGTESNMTDSYDCIREFSKLLPLDFWHEHRSEWLGWFTPGGSSSLNYLEYCYKKLMSYNEVVYAAVKKYDSKTLDNIVSLFYQCLELPEFLSFISTIDLFKSKYVLYCWDCVPQSVVLTFMVDKYDLYARAATKEKVKEQLRLSMLLLGVLPVYYKEKNN